MKKKILILSVLLSSVLVLSVLSVLPVYAGKGQNKQSFSFEALGSPIPVYGDNSHASPVWSRGEYTDYQRAFHGRDCPHAMITWNLKINGETETVTGIVSSCDFEINWQTQMVTHRTTETLTLLGGTIELSIVERLYYPIDGEDPFVVFGGEGKLVGFGTSVYEGVKMSGTTSTWMNMPLSTTPPLPFPTIGIRYDGTIMGWA